MISDIEMLERLKKAEELGLKPNQTVFECPFEELAHQGLFTKEFKDRWNKIEYRFDRNPRKSSKK